MIIAGSGIAFALVKVDDAEILEMDSAFFPEHLHQLSKLDCFIFFSEHIGGIPCRFGGLPDGISCRSCLMALGLHSVLKSRPGI